jgi:LPXTG-motif cell wall-anchored protein
MNQFLRSRTVRVALPSVAALAVAGTIAGAPAYAADVPAGTTATYAAAGDGLNDVVPDAENKFWPASSHTLTLADGTDLEVYCIDFNNYEIEKSGAYKASGWPANGLTEAQLAKITDITTRHSSIGTPIDINNPAKAGETLGLDNVEAAATQVAVWTISNGIKYESIPNTQFRARVKEIVDGATEVPATPVVGYTIESKKSVSGEGKDAKLRVDALLKTNAGAPVPDQALEFVVDGVKTQVLTDATGAASFTAGGDKEARTVSINYSVEVGPGAVFTPESGKQPMISATGFKLNDSVKVSVDPAAVPDPEPTPEPETPDTPVTVDEEPSPDPERDPVPESFPETGAGSALFGLLGASALGGAGFWGLRRFRNR